MASKKGAVKRASFHFCCVGVTAHLNMVVIRNVNVEEAYLKANVKFIEAIHSMTLLSSKD